MQYNIVFKDILQMFWQISPTQPSTILSVKNPVNSKQALKSDTASINCIIVLKRLNLTRLPDLSQRNTPETLKAAILHSHLQ